MPINHKRSVAVVAAKAAEKAERQAMRAQQADLQAIVDGIDSGTTLAQLRGHVKEVARTSKRIIRLSVGA